MDGGRESRFGIGVMIGIGMIVGGAVLVLLFFGAGAATFARRQDASLIVLAGAGVLLIIAGICTIAAIIGYGIWSQRKESTSKALRIENGAWVQARFALNAVGEMIFTEEHFDPWDPKVKLFVRLKYPDGRTDEVSTSFETWKQCGEGQVGIAQIQGNWLGQFTPQRRA